MLEVSPLTVTGNISSSGSGETDSIPFSEALLNGLYQTIYNQQTGTIAILDSRGSKNDSDSNTLHMDINKAIRATKLPASFCLVYDTDLAKQVSEAHHL